MNDLLVRAARGEQTERPPVWMMRQAGRHLPEYRDIRSEYSFREAIQDPEVAERITLLPWKRYRPDGIVMFSDILTALDPLGFDYYLEAGTGPVIENPIETPEDIPETFTPIEKANPYVGTLLDRLQDSIGDASTIIGFAGGPFTLASYLVAGGTSRGHEELRRFRFQEPEAFEALLALLTDVICAHLEYQVSHGAEVVQLFDTYAGVLSGADFRTFILPHHQKICSSIDVPVIEFVRHMDGKLDLLDESGADVVGLDWTVEMSTARRQLGDTPVQGNLDPQWLFAEDRVIEAQTRALIEAAGDSGHILNLGHGVHKDTPPRGVETFVETAKAIQR